MVTEKHITLRRSFQASSKLLLGLLIISIVVLGFSLQANAVFKAGGPHSAPSAPSDNPKGTSPPSPSPSPSDSESPSVSKTPITTDENKTKDSDQAHDKQSTTDITPWLVGGGLLLATMLTGAIFLSKKKK